MVERRQPAARELERRIAVNGGKTVSSLWGIPAGYDRECGTALIIAHGAGNDMRHPMLRFLHRSFSDRGILVVRFNFPYKEEGRKAPDRPGLLEDTWRAVISRVRDDPRHAPAKLFLAGKSMGGRLASHLAAQGEPIDGLVFFGYPLHPARRPERLRTEHLGLIRCPMLFIEGTRDSLRDLELLDQALAGVDAPVVVHRIEGGDHSFRVPKRLGPDETEVWVEMAAAAADWIQRRRP